MESAPGKPAGRQVSRVFQPNRQEMSENDRMYI